MVRGRKKIYDEPRVVSLKVERRIHDIALYLNLSDSGVYTTGLIEIIKNRAAELTLDQIDTLIQASREDMKEAQDRTAWLERVRMDIEIGDEIRKRKIQKKIETRIDERGRVYQVVIAP
jgi:hypothetical protein